MIIIKPNCQYLPEEENKHVEHVVKCASICYGNDPFKDPEHPIDYIKIYNNLIRQNHISPLRHSTYYYIIPSDVITDTSDFNNLLCGLAYDFDTKKLFVSINAQYYRERDDMFGLFYDKYRVSKHDYIKEIHNIKNTHTKKEAFNTLRYTFIITTQISTSRELNRTSPNNICEQSTRYCKFSLPKFGEDVTICQPHWLDICTEPNVILKGVVTDKNKLIECSSVKITKHIDKYYITTSNLNTFELGEEYPVIVKGIPQDDGSSICYSTDYAEKYIKSCCDDSILYGEAIKAGVAPQDARGKLPLDTATKVVYTYTYKEWQHILDLRLRGTTGKPHPNAKEVMKLLEPILEEQHNLDMNEN